MAATKELDKSWEAAGVSSYGTIRIRVVVLHRKKAGAQPVDLPDPDDTDPIVEGRTPIDSYLERPDHGKQCVVFLVNGQRHDALDSAFLARDLNLKYLRTRTMVMVDLDGLAPEAIGEIVQGSRQGLYQGNVLEAIKDRLFSTLKKDPDLRRLQEEAEQEISQLESGDEEVRRKLDQLIDAHHAAAERVASGEAEEGDNASSSTHGFGKDKQQPVVIKAPPTIGDEATNPTIASDCAPSVRIAPGSARNIYVYAEPEDAWASLEALEARSTPEMDGFSLQLQREERRGRLILAFEEPADFDREPYPVDLTLAVYAKFKGLKEPRLLAREVRIVPRRKLPPPPPELLLPTPTYMKVVSRQPVQLVKGGASTHVRLKWNGQNGLASGANPAWKFAAKCTSLNSFPPISFSSPMDGRFEVLLDAPHGLIPDAQLEFEVEAMGPEDLLLHTSFRAVVVNAPVQEGPRKLLADAPEASSHRRPPYDLRYVGREEWLATCWEETDFTAEDVGCYQEPTDTKPLTLIINKDAEIVDAFKQSMIERKLEETTIQARLTKYNSHISFHLYQMYRAQKERERADADLKPLDSADLREEINRVGSTLLRLMDLGER